MKEQPNKHVDESPFLLGDIFNLHPEPYKYFQDLEVHEILTGNPRDYFDFSLQFVRDIALGRARMELPPKQLFTDPYPGGDFRVMPCVVRRGKCISKTVKLVGTNLQQEKVPGQITVGKAFALDAEENYITHMFEACLLSSARTGLCAALGIHLLGKNPESIAIVGAGRVGYYSAIYANTAVSPDEIIVFDKDKQRLSATVGLLKQNLKDTVVSIGDENDVQRADTVILATTSDKPLYGPGDINADLVISLGADTDEQHELKSDWVGKAQLFVDTKDSANYGDLKLWREGGLIEDNDLTDLFTLLQNPGEVDGGRCVYVSTGSALFDNLTMAYILSVQNDGS